MGNIKKGSIDVEGRRYKRKTTANKKRAMNEDNPWCLNELQCSELSVVKCAAVQDKALFKNHNYSAICALCTKPSVSCGVEYRL